jgi:hypothetical protein
VFRLAAALPAERGPAVAKVIRDDLRKFVAAFAPESPEWTDLLKSLKADFGAAVPRPQELLSALGMYFSLGKSDA